MDQIISWLPLIIIVFFIIMNLVNKEPITFVSNKSEQKADKGFLKRFSIALVAALTVLFIGNEIQARYNVSNQLEQLGYLGLIVKDQPEKYSDVENILLRAAKFQTLSKDEIEQWNQLLAQAQAELSSYYFPRTSYKAYSHKTQKSLGLLKTLEKKPEQCFSWVTGQSDSRQLEEQVGKEIISAYDEALKMIVMDAITNPKEPSSVDRELVTVEINEKVESRLGNIKKRPEDISTIQDMRDHCKFYILLLEEVLKLPEEKALAIAGTL